MDWKKVGDTVAGEWADEPMTWSVPGPPPAYVLTVVDVDGQEWARLSPVGFEWHLPGRGSESWDWLIYNRGPITAGQLAR